MSLLGIDIGTTGCKASAHDADGMLLGTAYASYGISRPRADYAELDAVDVWQKVQDVITCVAKDVSEPIQAISVSSLGEACVPVTKDRKILARSLLNFDSRDGVDWGKLPERSELYRITGNVAGPHYGINKLSWIMQEDPELYQEMDHYLPWASFITFMLGADAAVDYSLANRVYCFDVDKCMWSEPLLRALGLDIGKLPRPVASTCKIGEVDAALAKKLGLGAGVSIIAGTHDQCANGLGAGVIEEGTAMYGMGTYVCFLPVFQKKPDIEVMMKWGLHTEHHPMGDRYLTFLYNMGCAYMDWYTETFAASEKQANASSVYDILCDEMPDGPSGLTALPHFAPTGPPHFFAEANGVIAGLKMDTKRGEILKCLLESVTFSIMDAMDGLRALHTPLTQVHAVGGGSRSLQWLQLTADCFNLPIKRLNVYESGVLGTCMLAAVGSGVYSTLEDAIANMLPDGSEQIDPRAAMVEQYKERYLQYVQLRQLHTGV